MLLGNTMAPFSIFLALEINGQPRWPIRIDWGLKPGGTRFESRSGRIFVVVVVHIQCSKLLKGLECTVLPVVLCTIKNP